MASAARLAGAAVRETLRDPQAWLQGCAGFLARGGLVVVAIELWSIPSPAGISLFIPPLAISASGVSPAFAAFLLVVGLVAAALVAAAGVVSALVDIVSYGRVTRTAPPKGRSLGVLAAQLVLLEAVALVPALVAAAVAARRLLEIGRSEYLVPSSLAVPFVVRVVERARDQVLALALSLLLAEVVYAVGSRWLLHRAAVRRERAPSPTTPQSPARSPAWTARRLALLLAGWAAAWCVTLLVVGGGVLGVSATRSFLEGMTFALSAGAGLPAVLEFVAAVSSLVATWMLALLLAGAVSSARSALWTELLVVGRPRNPSVTLPRPVGTPGRRVEEAR